MKTKLFIQILILSTISQMHVPAYAQHTATAVMNVTVEVVPGSSVEINQNDLITFTEESHAEVIFAVFSITHDRENSILIYASETVQMINGMDSVLMNSVLTESHDEDGRITLEFSTGNENLFRDGIYSGRQVAEIIYL